MKLSEQQQRQLKWLPLQNFFRSLVGQPPIDPGSIINPGSQAQANPKPKTFIRPNPKRPKPKPVTVKPWDFSWRKAKAQPKQVVWSKGGKRFGPIPAKCNRKPRINLLVGLPIFQEQLKEQAQRQAVPVWTFLADRQLQWLLLGISAALLLAAVRWHLGWCFFGALLIVAGMVLAYWQRWLLDSLRGKVIAIIAFIAICMVVGYFDLYLLVKGLAILAFSYYVWIVATSVTCEVDDAHYRRANDPDYQEKK